MTSLESLSAVTCRPALPKDYADVIELTRTIWDGQDYVPHHWKDWLADPDNLLVSAEYGGRVVGMGRLAPFSPGDWWLQALRVHPDYQGKGIATRLHDYLFGYWEQHLDGTVRLTTMDDRYQVHHMCARSGFQKINEILWYSRAIEPGQPAPQQFQLVRVEEAPHALEVIHAGDLLPEYRGLLDKGWEWMRPHTSVIEAFIHEGRMWWWSAPDASLGLLAEYDDDDDEGHKFFTISAPSCKRGHFINLLKDAEVLASSMGFSRIEICTPVEVFPELPTLGYEPAWDHSIYIYEKAHPKLLSPDTF